MEIPFLPDKQQQQQHNYSTKPVVSIKWMAKTAASNLKYTAHAVLTLLGMKVKFQFKVSPNSGFRV